MGIHYYGKTICQVTHVLPFEIHRTILANQISITDFCRGT